MKDFCFRQALFDLFPDESNVSVQAMVLLGCHLCNHNMYEQTFELIESHSSKTQENVSLYEILLLWPMILSFCNSSNIYERVKECLFLEIFGKEFSEHNLSKEETAKRISEFISSLKRNDELTFIHKTSASEYCQMAAMIYSNGDYPLLRMLALVFWWDRVDLSGGGGRINIYYRDHVDNISEFIFSIGVSINEGLTEVAAISDFNTFFKELGVDKEIKDSIGIDCNNNNRISEAYYFEIMFYKKVCKILQLDAQKIASDNGKDILFHLFSSNRTGNLCNIYELLSISDELDWKKTEEVLKRWK